MLNGITELLNEVIANPESIQIPKSDHEENQEIKRLNAEISKALYHSYLSNIKIQQCQFPCKRKFAFSLIADLSVHLFCSCALFLTAYFTAAFFARPSFREQSAPSS